METQEGYWIIDHKTDKTLDENKHYPQLLAYANSLTLNKPILGMMVHWVRFGQLTCYPTH
jgi:hypothetical protein